MHTCIEIDRSSPSRSNYRSCSADLPRTTPRDRLILHITSQGPVLSLWVYLQDQQVVSQYKNGILTIKNVVFPNWSCLLVRIPYLCNNTFQRRFRQSYID